MESIWTFFKNHALPLFVLGNLFFQMYLLWRSIRKRNAQPKEQVDNVAGFCVFCAFLLYLPASYPYAVVAVCIFEMCHRVIPTFDTAVACILVGIFIFVWTPIVLFYTTRLCGKFFVYKDYITMEQYEQAFSRTKLWKPTKRKITGSC